MRKKESKRWREREEKGEGKLRRSRQEQILLSHRVEKGPISASPPTPTTLFFKPIMPNLGSEPSDMSNSFPSETILPPWHQSRLKNDGHCKKRADMNGVCLGAKKSTYQCRLGQIVARAHHSTNRKGRSGCTPSSGLIYIIILLKQGKVWL